MNCVNSSFMFYVNKIRTNKIFIKPFLASPSAFSATNGASYAQVHCSYDGDNWEFLCKIPSGFGSNQYPTELMFNECFTFKYLRFSTDNNSYFSISYLGLKNEK